MALYHAAAAPGIKKEALMKEVIGGEKSLTPPLPPSPTLPQMKLHFGVKIAPIKTDLG